MPKDKKNLLLGVIIVLLMVIIYLLLNDGEGQEESFSTPETDSFPLFEERAVRNQVETPATDRRFSVPDPDELTDQEIRNVRERIKRETGGEYYYYTPGRSVESSDKKDKDWAMKNVRNRKQ